MHAGGVYIYIFFGPLKKSKYSGPLRKKKLYILFLDGKAQYSLPILGP